MTRLFITHSQSLDTRKSSKVNFSLKRRYHRTICYHIVFARIANVRSVKSLFNVYRPRNGDCIENRFLGDLNFVVIITIISLMYAC